jgi:hypothetical protein
VDDLPATDPSVPDHLRSWATFAEEAEELAAAVRARLEAAKHHVLATLDRGGSPRVSGTEVAFLGDHLTVGSMWMAVKAIDLRRDGRFALHSNPGDGSMDGGDSKLSGVAVEVGGELLSVAEAELEAPGPFHLFRLDLARVVHSAVHPKGDRMLIRWWEPGCPIHTVER